MKPTATEAKAPMGGATCSEKGVTTSQLPSSTGRRQPFPAIPRAATPTVPQTVHARLIAIALSPLCIATDQGNTRSVRKSPFGLIDQGSENMPRSRSLEKWELLAGHVEGSPKIVSTSK